MPRRVVNRFLLEKAQKHVKGVDVQHALFFNQSFRRTAADVDAVSHARFQGGKGILLRNVPDHHTAGRIEIAGLEDL